MLNKTQKDALKDIMQRHGWEALTIFTGLMIDKWRASDIKADTEFETLWRTAQREAKTQFLLEFFDTLDREVLN